MQARWRGRLLGLAILAALTGPLSRADAAPAGPHLVLRGPDGEALTEVPLRDGGFALRYRNSLYRSLAEERYLIQADGSIRLVGLAADELAVLEEYYAIDEPAVRLDAGATRTWSAEPAREVVIETLIVAATDLGQRTLLVDGVAPMELWPLVHDTDPSVTLEVAWP